MTKDHRVKKTNSANATMAVLVIGGILVLALVGWALSRSVAPQAPVTPPQSADAGSAPAGQPPVPADDHNHDNDELSTVKRISVDDLKALVDAGNVTIVDVRDANSFAVAHIPGSLHIPMARIEGELGFLPKSKPIVAYCT